MYFDGRTANYEKEPYLEITQKDAQAFWGFVEIADCLKMKIEQLQKERVIVVIDYYHGVRQKEIEKLIDLIENPKTTIIDKFTVDGTLFPGASVRNLAK